MTIREIHAEVKLRGNKINSNHYEDLSSYVIDSKIHEAELFLVENLAEMNQVAFENSQARTDQFSTLVVTDEEIELENLLISEEGEYFIYEIPLSSLKNEYYHHVRSSIVCDNKIVEVSITKHDELTRVLNDSLQKPDLMWGRVVGLFAKNKNGTKESLYLYSNKKLNKILISYIKYPRKVFFGDYDSIEYLYCTENNGTNCTQFYNTGTQPITSELPESYHSLLVDVTVYLISQTTENIQLASLIKNKLNHITNLN